MIDKRCQQILDDREQSSEGQLNQKIRESRGRTKGRVLRKSRSNQRVAQTPERQGTRGIRNGGARLEMKIQDCWQAWA